MLSTNIEDWAVLPDIIADGVSDQEEIMTAICETKGAAYDGTDCVGELDDSPVFVSTKRTSGQPGAVVVSQYQRGEFDDSPVFVNTKPNLTSTLCNSQHRTNITSTVCSIFALADGRMLRLRCTNNSGAPPSSKAA